FGLSSRDEGFRTAAETYYPRLLEAFETTYGEIEDFYVTREVEAAAILTRDDYFTRSGDSRPKLSDEPAAESLLGRCDTLYTQMMEVLPADRRKIGVRLVYKMVTYFMAALDVEEARWKEEKQK